MRHAEKCTVIALAAAALTSVAHAQSRGTGWKYRDPSGSAGGVTHVTVKRGSRTPDEWTIAVDGRHGGWASAFAVVPLQVAIALAVDPSAGAPCAATAFSPARCTYNASGRTLRCVPPPPPPRCPSSSPDADVRCAALRAAAAEEAFYATSATYCGGDCAGLGDFVTPRSVLCLATAAGDLAYSVVTTSSAATPAFACVYREPALAGEPNLVCAVGD